MPYCLTVSGLPRGLCGPLRLVAVEAIAEQPSVCIKQDCRGPSPYVAEVTIPMLAWVCDARGCTHCGNTQVTVCCRLPPGCANARGSLMAAAEVRLADGGCPSCVPTFDVRLQVCVEVYMVRMEPCGSKEGKKCPPFPPKPMYPQPHWYYE